MEFEFYLSNRFTPSGFIYALLTYTRMGKRNLVVLYIDLLIWKQIKLVLLCSTFATNNTMLFA